MTDAVTGAQYVPQGTVPFSQLKEKLKEGPVPFTVVHLSRPYPHPAALLPLPSNELYLWMKIDSRNPVQAAQEYFTLLAKKRKARQPGWLPTAFNPKYCSGFFSLKDDTVMVNPNPKENPWRGLAAAGLVRRAHPDIHVRVEGLLDGNLYTLGPHLDMVSKHDLAWLLGGSGINFPYQVMLPPSDQDTLLEAAARNSIPSGLFIALSHNRGAALHQLHHPNMENVALLRNGRPPTREEQLLYGIKEQQPIHATNLEEMLKVLSNPESGVYLAHRQGPPTEFVSTPATGFVPTYLFAGTFDELCWAVGTIEHQAEDTRRHQHTSEGGWRPLRLPQSPALQSPEYSVIQ